MALAETRLDDEHLPIRIPEVAPVGILLVKIGLEAKRRFTEALRPTQLSPRHVVALLELDRGPASQQALCDAVGVDASKLVGLLNDLEADGLVERRRDSADRRRHIVQISELGRTRLAAAREAATAVDERLLSALSGEERGKLQSFLVRIAESNGLGSCPELAAPDP